MGSGVKVAGDFLLTDGNATALLGGEVIDAVYRCYLEPQKK